MSVRPGYLTQFTPQGQSAITLVNHTTQRGLDVVSYMPEIETGVITLPNGVKVATHGVGSTVLVIPGTISQRILCASGGNNLWAALMGKVGTYGELVHTYLGGGSLFKVDAIMLTPVDDTNRINTRAFMNITVSFEIVGSWSAVT